MSKKYPLYPTADKALVSTLASFGISRDNIYEVSDEMREHASRFNIEAAIQELEQQIEQENQKS